MTALKLVLALTVGVAVGLYVGRALHDGDSATDRGPIARSDAAARAPKAVPHSVDREAAFDVSIGQPRTLAEILTMPSDFEQTLALYRLARDADASALEVLLDEALTLHPVSESQAATGILYSRYGELDPDRAVDHMLSRGDAFAARFLHSVMHPWARRDVEAAAARVATFDPGLKVVAGRALLISRDDLTGVELAEIAVDLGLEDQLPQIQARQQAALTYRDPESAWRAASTLTDAQRRTGQMHAVIRTWAQSDPLAALYAIASVSAPDLRASLEQQVVHQWARRDPRAAIDWALAQPSSGQRRQSLRMAMRTLGARDPQMALQLSDRLEGQERREVLSSVLGGWASQDPRGAADWITDNADPQVSRDAAFSVGSAYARRFPHDAFDWAIALPSEQAQMASVAVVSSMSHATPRQAAELVLDMDDRQLRASAASQVVDAWASVDPEAAADWIDEFDEPAERANLYRHFAATWARNDPSTAADFVRRLPAGVERDAALTSIVIAQRQYGDLDFATALVQEIDEPGRRREAESYLEQMRNSPNTDRARLQVQSRRSVY